MPLLVLQVPGKFSYRARSFFRFTPHFTKIIASPSSFFRLFSLQLEEGVSTVLTDEELIEEIRDGSQAAMEVLVKRHYSDVYSYLYRKIGNRHTAYDLTQEVFIKMMQSLGNYRDKGRFRHWLLKIAVNHCYDYYRSKQYRHRHAHTELEVDMPDENSNVWDLFHCHYQQEQAKQAVLSLPEKQRDAIAWPLVERGLLQDIWDVPMLEDSYTKQLAEIRTELRLSAPGSYEYKKHALHERLLMEKGPPSGQVYYNKTWANIFYSIDQFGVAFMGVMILIGLAPLYSEEYTTGMDSLILSSRYGKGQLISAKCYAAILYAFICSAAFQLFNLGVIALLFGNLDGADTPLYSISRYVDSHSFRSSPYSWTVGQYYVIQFGVHIIGCIAFALAVMFVSSLSKSSFLTLFIAGCILGAPYVLNDMFNIRFASIEWLTTFSYSQFIRVTRLFTGFETVNIFHFPVLYPVAAVSCAVAVTGVLVWVTRRVFQRHQVT